MLIKLIHIPFYILIFVFGMVLVAVMVVPVFVMLTPFLILMLAIGHFILHFFFVADVISAIVLYRTAKKKKQENIPLKDSQLF